MSTNIIPRHCVVVPFLNRLDQAAKCIHALLNQAKSNTVFLLVDDGSTPQAIRSIVMQPILCHKNVYLIHHKDNYGIAAARNSAFHWCRKNNIEIMLMLDSDCMPESNVISEHLRLHREHPDVACIGATIVGQGKGLWAQLDGLMSWVHASPHKVKKHPRAAEEFRKVEHPYHLATTNFSVKLAQLPLREFVLDERLITGEDCFLVRALRKENKAVYFSATPRVFHQDRESFWSVLKHHYEWGHHQYFIQLGGDVSPRCFRPIYRLLFVLAFTPLLPLFALLGATLNVKPLLKTDPLKLLFFPLVYLLWLSKGVAVLEAAIRPAACLKIARTTLTYEEAQLD